MTILWHKLNLFSQEELIPKKYLQQFRRLDPDQSNPYLKFMTFSLSDSPYWPGLFPEPTFLMPLNVGKNVDKSREVIVEGIR